MGNVFRKTQKVQNKNELYELYQKITKKTHNSDVSDRLIESTKIKYPNRNLVWVYEKVLNDLERDYR